MADSKVYTEAKAANLACLLFLTRLPEPLQVTQQVIEQAWAWGQGHPLEETTS
jgi:transposase